MAINVNTVYQTVLSILNKEQRGYLTPDEFNKTATQVQLEIFEKYFEDLNQQIRVPQTDLDYADRFLNLDEKLAIFKTYGEATYNTTDYPGIKYFKLPTTDAYNTQAAVHTLGTVTYTDSYGNITELQRLSRTDFYNIQKSPLTKANESFPTYLYESLPNQNIAGQSLTENSPRVLYVNPSTITSGINVDYIRKPSDVKWGFSIAARGNYIFDDNFYNPGSGQGSKNFELHESEQTNVILRILAYAGIIIEDPTIVQIASQQVSGREANKKS